MFTATLFTIALNQKKIVFINRGMDEYTVEY